MSYIIVKTNRYIIKIHFKKIKKLVWVGRVYVGLLNLNPNPPYENSGWVKLKIKLNRVWIGLVNPVMGFFSL